jgi:hypothetical protein
MLTAYAASVEQLKTMEEEGLSGSCYFQMFDVEREQQGFLTYDREVTKIPRQELERLHTQLVPRARNYAAATEGFCVQSADWTPEAERYSCLLSEFRCGRRDLSFLRRLALMALRQGDEAQATELSDAFVTHAPQPFTRQIWETIIAITQTRRDRGFELLRANAEQVNAVLGAQTAEMKLLEIIQRERIAPYFHDKQRKLSWQEFTKSVAAEHGALGMEAVYGARMMDALLKEDWTSFGSWFVQYFATAIPRSPYLRHSLCHRVLVHVSNTAALETAIRVMRWLLDVPKESPVLGRYDPTELDTYANLLHKVGRAAEALDWQQQAVALSDGRDRDILANLQKMCGH